VKACAGVRHVSQGSRSLSSYAAGLTLGIETMACIS